MKLTCTCCFFTSIIASELPHQGRSSHAKLPNMAVCASQVLKPKDTCFWQNGVKFEGGI